MSIEPAKAYWAVAIAGSLALHAGAVGAAAILIGSSYKQKTVVTDITFSAPPPSAAAPLTSSAERITALKQLAAPADHAGQMEYQVLQPATPLAATLSDSIKAASATTVEAVPVAAVETVPAARKEAAPAVTLVTGPAKTVHSVVQPRLSHDTVQQVQPETAISAEIAAEAARVSANMVHVPANPVRRQPGAVQPQSPVRVQTTEQVAAVEVAAPAPLLSSGTPPATSPAAVTAIAPTAAPLAGRTQTKTAMASQNADPLSTAAPSAASAAVANTEAQRLQPIAPGASSATPAQRLQPAAPVASGITPAPAATPSSQPAIAPVVRPAEVALLVPARPGSSLGTETDRPSQRYLRVIDFIRNFDGGSCFVALPAIGSSGSVEFQTFGKDKALEAEFTTAYASALGIVAHVSLGNVADSQCLALSFARKVERYPAFSLIIELEAAEVTSGSILSGAILNVKDRPVNLLVIDDEGQVQAVDRFLSAPNGTDRRFSAPLTLTSGPVTTKQLLMAIATDRPVQLLDGKINEPATNFFPRLASEIAESGADIDIALEGISVW
jgi:hypothetical protein